MENEEDHLKVPQNAQEDGSTLQDISQHAENIYQNNGHPS
jgi:hypothetical protein